MVAQRRTCGVFWMLEVAMMYPFQSVRKNTMAWQKRRELMRIKPGKRSGKNFQTKKKTAEAVFPSFYPAGVACRKKG
jgi:hypothetical protein